MSSFAIFVSILALLVSFGAAMYTYKLSRNNFLHSIQKLVLDKAKDCNTLYIKEAYRMDHVTIDNIQFEEDIFDYSPIIIEIMTSIKLLDNSLREYSQTKKREFFLNQFWTQIELPLKHEIKFTAEFMPLDNIVKKYLAIIKVTFVPLVDE